MNKILYILIIFYLIYLVAESFSAARFRHNIKHVVYVNGTRGKSSVTRLIYAGLRAGGIRTFCKTTGTLPMTIDTNGKETLICRRGRANIKEQIKILKMAAKEKAEVLVIECMAVQPELQYISQHRMVKSDIGVITNVRFDHLDVMGDTLDEIGNSLCNTVPEDGVCFTSDERFFPLLKTQCNKLNCVPRLVLPKGDEPDFDFQENISLSLEICKQLGIDEHAALEGMANYQRDPYAVDIYKLRNNSIFIGGFSINDPMSIKIVYNKIMEKFAENNFKLILLINNRLDRGYRTFQHTELAVELRPDKIWIMGGNRRVMARNMEKQLPSTSIKVFNNAKDLPLNSLKNDEIIFAFGNVGDSGNKIMDRVKKEGVLYV